MEKGIKQASKRSGAFLIAFFGLLSNIAAHTQLEQNFVCPLDGKAFNQTMSTSGTSYGEMLDFKPYGPIASPWPLPVCPENGFVIYKSGFSDKELELLRPLVKTQQYKDANQHYRAFVMAKLLGAPLNEQFSFLLNATWRDGDEYRPQALALLQKLLEEPSVRPHDRFNYLLLLKGEFERRLGLFEQSKQTFELVEKFDCLRTPATNVIVTCQKELLAQKNANPSPIPNDHLKCGSYAPPSY